MKQKIQNFFVGRNGFDDLSRFLMYFALAVIVLSGIVSIFSNFLGSVLWALGLALIVYGYWRALSKNVYKRADENSRFLTAKYARKSKFAGSRERFSQRKEYKFFTCPSCHVKLRVPRGKGKLILTCKKCGTRFEGKT